MIESHKLSYTIYLAKKSGPLSIQSHHPLLSALATKKYKGRFSRARPNLWNGHPSEACSGPQGHAQRVDGHARQGLGQARSNFLHFCRTSPVSKSWERSPSPSPPWSPSLISEPTWNSRSHLAVELQSATTTDISSFHEQGSESE